MFILLTTKIYKIFAEYSTSPDGGTEKNSSHWVQRNALVVTLTILRIFI